MANTYTQLNIQAVFSVKGRKNLLSDKLRPELFKYIHGILKNMGIFPLAVNGYKDHVHIFFEMDPSKALSDIMRDVKANSSKWINTNQLVAGRFSWQEGYGGFSYSRSQRNKVINYIMRQEEHHREKTFREEYLDLLTKFEIEFKDEYLFEFYD
jgi:REP element-mobilizing transposase RayT